MARDTHMIETDAPTGDTLSPLVDIAKINTLHELLALACDDFEKVLNDKRYMVRMDAAHRPRSDGRCEVCLAGAVIANTYHCDPNQDLLLDEDRFSAAAQQRLFALDYLRIGQITQAASCLNDLSLDEQPTAVKPVHAVWSGQMCDIGYACGAEQGRELLAKLRLMQAELKEAGL